MRAAQRALEVAVTEIGVARAALRLLPMRATLYAYAAGLGDFLDVLDVRRTALSRHRELLRACADSARFAVATLEALRLIDEPDAVDASTAPRRVSDRDLAQHLPQGLPL